MKKILVTLLAAATALSITACSGNSGTAPQSTGAAESTAATEKDKAADDTTAAQAPDQTTPAPAEKKTISKIGVSINATSNENNRAMFEYAQEAIKSHGYECVATNADGVISKQAQDIENLITQGCDALILINADKDSTTTLVQQAKDAGIIVVTYAGGFIKGNEFVTIYPGTVADTATKAEAALLANPEVDAIWGVEDLVALGCLQACEALGRDDVIMVGIDGEQDILKHIYEGAKQVKGTAIGDNAGGMASCVESIERFANGEEVALFQEIPYVVVTQENIADYYTP